MVIHEEKIESSDEQIDFTICTLENGDEDVICEEGEQFTIAIKKLFDTSIIKSIGYDLDHLLGFHLEKDDCYTHVKQKLGYFSSVINEIIHKTIYKMKLNELVRVSFEVDPDYLDESLNKKYQHQQQINKVYLDLSFEIRLVKVEKLPEDETKIYKLNEDQLYKLCLEHKNDANELFKKSMIRTAFQRYHKSITYLIIAIQLLKEKKKSQETRLDEEIETSVDNIENYDQLMKTYLETKSQLYSNLAICQLKNNNYDMAIINCTKCLELDKTNVKALFRRAQARTGLNDYDEALEDFRLALKFDPNNQVIKQKRAHVEQLKKAYNIAISKNLKKMFTS